MADCPFCINVPSPLIGISPFKYKTCASCYEGARALMAMINNMDSTAIRKINCPTISPPGTSSNSSKGLSAALEWVKDLKDKVAYLAGFVAAFRDQIHTDIQVKPDNGPCIPSHRALLAARSIVFKNMLDFDNCMAPPAQQEVVKLGELDYEELQAFLEFLYSGNLSTEKMEKHVYSLLMAADKYEVSFLQEFCEQHMLKTLNSENALHVLEISDTCSSSTLKVATLRFIIQNMDDIVVGK